MLPRRFIIFFPLTARLLLLLLLLLPALPLLLRLLLLPLDETVSLATLIMADPPADIRRPILRRPVFFGLGMPSSELSYPRILEAAPCFPYKS